MLGISWWIIIAFVVVFLLLLKFRHMRHRAFVIVVILLIFFFYLTASTLFAGTDVDLKTVTGMVTAGKIYGQWLGHAVGNARTVLGNAVKMDWVGEPPKVNINSSVKK